jgi:pimeloyl-[acyl-carrier protein] methyl ester esterase
VFIESLGSGPSVVLLHGWAMHGGVFHPIAERLAAAHTVHLVDLPGHGRSSERDGHLDPADIARRISESVPPAIWIGWSLGGLVALNAALTQEWHVRGLGLIAASPRFVVGPDWPHGVEHEVFASFGRDLAFDYRRTLDRFLALETHGSDCQRADLRTLRAKVFEHGEPAPHVLEDGLRLLADSDYRAALATLAVPSAWIAGARDRLIPAGAMEWSAARCGGDFLHVAGGGHAPFIGHPEPVLAALASLSRRVNGTDGRHA